MSFDISDLQKTITKLEEAHKEQEVTNFYIIKMLEYQDKINGKIIEVVKKLGVEIKITD